ncbi:UNKNOWN [Stylonychia lemnae]|uniref:Uncharacterized protein n=1 Tax=Stylonychia lemnae TaxID=5949 RepID=A0A078ASU0_STYLE|nr:UNKNOWN [Stylonychia lemnae]|eukprot:CDW83893.1 UNKNOWN [Stylonychia lemnae]
MTIKILNTKEQYKANIQSKVNDSLFFEHDESIIDEVSPDRFYRNSQIKPFMRNLTQKQELTDEKMLQNVESKQDNVDGQIIGIEQEMEVQSVHFESEEIQQRQRNIVTDLNFNYSANAQDDHPNLESPQISMKIDLEKFQNRGYGAFNLGIQKNIAQAQVTVNQHRKRNRRQQFQSRKQALDDI